MIRLKWKLRDWPGERGFRKALRTAVTAGGEILRREILPEHFTEAGARRYHYARRAPRYLKSRAKRGQPPLVLSGLTRAQALASAGVRVQIGGKKGTHLKVRFSVSAYIVRRKPAALGGGRGPDMRKELTSLVQNDLRRIIPAIDAKMEELINARRARNSHRRRSA